MHQKHINCTHKVRSSDADIDNICDGLSCVALPLAAANSLQQINIIIVNRFVYKMLIVESNSHKQDD